MLAAIGSVLFVLAFAWGARAALDARELTWPRTLLAAVIGISVGPGVAALLLLQDVTAPEEIDLAQLRALALPFQLLGTMAAIVLLEVLFSGPPRRRRLRPVRPLRAVRRWVGVVLRALQVLRIVARHGLAPLLGLRSGEVSARSPSELARRARSALEDAGGMFVKLGQLLATRPDLLPPDVLAELGRLHASASPLPREDIERVVRDETGRPLAEVFAEIDWDPLGSASIAQVHAARLTDGRAVVVKIRRPGLEDQVERDLAIARWLARTAERRTGWGRAYEVTALAGEFADALRAELDFRIEGRNAVEAAAAVADHAQLRVPVIVEPLTTERMLVMERLAGQPLSRLARDRVGEDARRLTDALCTSQVSAMLRGERFHGDPHPGNVLLLDDGTLGLIDFGITGRLDVFERSSVFQMLVAIRLEQPTLLYEAMVSMGAVSVSEDPAEVERAFAQFMAAYLGPGLPPPEALVELLRLTAELRIRLPRSTTSMFRALATLSGTLEHIHPDYPIIDVIADLGGVELRQRMTPGSAGEFVQQEWAQVGPLLRRAPRHLDRVATLLEHGRLVTRVRLFADADDVRVLERLVNRAVLTALAIGIGVVSVMMLGVDGGPEMPVVRVRFLEAIGWSGLFVATILLLRVLLAVLRADREPRAGP